MKVHYPKLYNMAHLFTFNVFTDFKGSNNYILFTPSFFEIGPPVPEKKIFEGFYHIWAWRPSSSCDLDYLYIH